MLRHSRSVNRLARGPLMLSQVSWNAPLDGPKSTITRPKRSFSRYQEMTEQMQNFVFDFTIEKERKDFYKVSEVPKLRAFMSLEISGFTDSFGNPKCKLIILIYPNISPPLLSARPLLSFKITSLNRFQKAPKSEFDPNETDPRQTLSVQISQDLGPK